MKKKGKIPAWIWLLVAGAIGLIYYVYKKDQANAAANQTSSIVQGSGVLSVLPNTSTTATPSGDTTWNPAWSKKNQQSTVNNALQSHPMMPA